MNTQLYWYWTTNPQKIRLALEEWNIHHELIPVHLGKGEHRSPKYRSIHPKGSVPTLIYKGQKYWESNAALLALSLEHPQMLPPYGTTEHANAINLLFMEACSFQRWAGVQYMEKKIYPLMGRESNHTRITEAQLSLQSSLDILEQQLNGKIHLFEHFSIVDCAFAPWLPYLNLTEHPNIDRWLSHLRQRESWDRCGFRK